MVSTHMGASARPVRVVYLIMSHRNPSQIRRLVDRILAGSERGHVLLAHDQFSCPLPTDGLADPSRVTVMPPIRVQWGDWSQVEVPLRGMRWALRELDFDWLCFLSGQDYPVQPLSWTEAELGRATADAFMEVPEVVRPFARDWLAAEGDTVRRYLYRYWSIPPVLVRRTPKRIQRAAHQLIVRTERRVPYVLVYPLPRGALPRVGVRRARVPFSDLAPCRKSAEWGAFSRRCVEAIDEFARRNPHAIRYFRRTILPIEAFLPTVVWNSPALSVHPDHRRCIRFPDLDADVPAAHPDVFRAHDLEFLVSSRAHFGRKFDSTVDERILDLLDEEIAARGGEAPPTPLPA